MKTKPFVKWVGGKTQLLPQLLELAPKEYGSYFEPFCGGAALFFALEPTRAWLNDFNPRLMNAFVQVMNDVQSVVAHLRTLERSETCYYQQRLLLNEEKVPAPPCNPFAVGDAATAARFIYLNKACFNGLWRENAAGQFNVPYGGDRKRARHVDVENLMDCSIKLRKPDPTFLSCQDFADAVRPARAGDFVYFDPPYVPRTASSFVDYTSDGFDYNDQVRLRDLARDLKARGVHVLLSNSDTVLTRKLYQGFELHEVQARRSINRNGAGRGRVGELIIR